jgi:hypothetical protein
MTDRTFKQYALAFGSTPAQAVCQIDGNTVYSGPVTTLDESLPELPNLAYSIDTVAWSWQANAEFSGSQEISITVTGSPLLLADTFANNPFGNAANFLPFYSTEQSGVTFYDPFTNEAIDGVVQSGPYDPALPGQWWWVIPAGSTFTATMHVDGVSPV